MKYDSNSLTEYPFSTYVQYTACIHMEVLSSTLNCILPGITFLATHLLLAKISIQGSFFERGTKNILWMELEVLI